MFILTKCLLVESLFIDDITVCFVLQLISAVVMKDWHDILKTCELQNWKEALAAVMTYAQPEEFTSLCGKFKDTCILLFD